MLERHPSVRRWLRGWSVRFLMVAVCWGGLPGIAEVPVPTGLSVETLPRHVQLRWDRSTDQETESFVIERAGDAEGAFVAIGRTERGLTVFSAAVNEPGATRHYRVRQARPGEGTVQRSAPSEVVAAACPTGLTDEELLDAIQLACFRYFWDFGHPVSGLARAGTKQDRDICISGGTGFGVLTIVVGVERGFVSRADAAERVLKITAFLEDKAERFHGAFSHRLDGRTGKTIPFFNPNDNGGDLPETAFLIQGLLAALQYFDGNDPVEVELRERITRLWHEVEWGWYLRYPGGKVLYWHWSPDQGWVKNHPLHGFNECMITYILGIASPTHPIPVESYYDAWAGKPQYTNEQTHYGLTQKIGRLLGGPLFFTHYSYLGLDPRRVTDRFVNYFDHNRVLSLMHHRYAIDNPKDHAGYSDKAWGLTSSHNPFKGYRGHAPLTEKDDGTIAPTAALSSFPYTPAESLAAARHFYDGLTDQLTDDLWGAFGFKDAFHVGEDWVSPDFLAIDVGPIAPMIENHRTGLCWRLFMQNREVIDALERVGIHAELSADHGR